MKIKIIKGDITKIKVDAIVNAANSSLLGGGGVDGAIHKAGGSELLKECMQIREREGGCKTGEAVYTTAGKIDAKYVIHTVGPIWQDGSHEEKSLLKSCYIHSMMIAKKLNCESISFPNISTGVYGFPKKEAVNIVFNLFTDQAFKDEYSEIRDVYFVNFDDENFKLYKGAFNNIESI
jgi:O-acetyl-ADP-ribose deacetylase (regulator of RNase III)